MPENATMIFRQATIVTVDPERRILVGDLRVSDGRIVEIAPTIGHAGSAEESIDCRGCLILPGFVQAHTHLCQSLMRNQADDLELMDWLTRHVWPGEAALDAEAMRAAARIGLFELISGGTTAILDMGSVRHTEILFAEAEGAGLRYTGGKCLMDLDETGLCPTELIEDAAASIEQSRSLAAAWHGAAGGRLRYAVSPRFAVSCSEGLLQAAGDLACAEGLRIHTHASENLGECEIVRRRTGRENVDYLSDVGLLGSHVVLAHGVHLEEREIHLIFGTGTHVAHCPTSNLKLASGIAKIPELLDFGINVALGADGAPCNNRLDMFREMHLASILQKPRCGPAAMPASRVLEMATLGGARALGLEDEIGSLEVGKRADLIVVDLASPEVSGGDPVSALLHAAGPRDVRDVLVDGRFLKRDFEVLTLAAADVLRTAHDARRRLESSGRDHAPSSPA